MALRIPIIARLTISSSSVKPARDPSFMITYTPLLGKNYLIRFFIPQFQKLQACRHRASGLGGRLMYLLGPINNITVRTGPGHQRTQRKRAPGREPEHGREEKGPIDQSSGERVYPPAQPEGVPAPALINRQRIG